mgnify:CR=1 FL=1
MIIIKKYNFTAKVKTSRKQTDSWMNKPWRVIALLAFLMTVSACNVTEPPAASVSITNETTQFSQYYLWLKTLTDEQIFIEEDKQNALLNAQQVTVQIAAQSKLILIYSLSTGVLHQPYKAKRLLNEFLLAGSSMSQENLAFTMLLRDQLNIQLKLREKHNKANKDFIKQSDEHHANIEQLEQQLKQVNQQLILLKKIDQNINQRG